MKFFKKALFFFLAAVYIVCFLCACGVNGDGGVDNGEPQIPDTAPDFSASEDGSVMTIGGWNPPIHSKKDYKIMQDAGFNMLHNVNWYNDDIEQSMVWLNELGMKGYIQLQGQKYKDWKGEHNKLNSFDGYNFFDEPSITQMDALTKQAQDFKKEFPGRRFFVNLFPNYATSQQLGVGSFGQYVDAYIQKVDSDVISYDFYPLLGNNLTSSVHAQYLQGLEIMGNAAKNSGRDFWCFIQSMSYGSNRRRPRSVADIRFQTYVNFAYGATGIQYFCYATPPIGPEFSAADYALINRNNEKTEIYDFAKEVNEEVLSFDNVLMQFDWINTMPIIGNETASKNSAYNLLINPLLTTGLFSDVSATQDTLIGVFKDNQDKYNGYMLVNYSDPGSGHSDSVSLTFNGAVRASIYKKGILETVELENGIYTCELESGEGRFIIPYN
jgi:hypothetical protein